MKTIIAATKNKHKIEEIREMTRSAGFKVVSEEEAGLCPMDVEETGSTFEENSLIKAMAVMEGSGKATIADDSGLEVDVLEGVPGIYSARFALMGDSKDSWTDSEGRRNIDDANNKKLIKLIENLPLEKRTARFVAVVTLVYPDGKILSARGQVEGHVIPEERGNRGFGYDPMFMPLGYDLTFGEMEPEEKNKISHRKKALDKLRVLLEREEKKQKRG